MARLCVAAYDNLCIDVFITDICTTDRERLDSFHPDYSKMHADQKSVSYSTDRENVENNLARKPTQGFSGYTVE